MEVVRGDVLFGGLVGVENPSLWDKRGVARNVDRVLKGRNP